MNHLLDSFLSYWYYSLSLVQTSPRHYHALKPLKLYSSINVANISISNKQNYIFVFLFNLNLYETSGFMSHSFRTYTKEKILYMPHNRDELRMNNFFYVFFPPSQINSQASPCLASRRVLSC
jgi:hypothetical protein